MYKYILKIYIHKQIYVYKYILGPLGQHFGSRRLQKPLAASHRTVCCAWLVATRALHGAENGPSTILIDFADFQVPGPQMYNIWGPKMRQNVCQGLKSMFQRRLAGNI